MIQMALRRSIKRIRPTARRDFESAVRAAVGASATRAILNAYYNRLSLRQKHAFYKSLRHIFYGNRPVRPCTWCVRLPNGHLRLPIGQSDTALEWEQALSLMGHDAEIRDFYFALGAQWTPAGLVMFDVGANYGLHSLLGLSLGWTVVPFEPNAACHAYFRDACQLNHIDAAVQAVALGETTGHVDFFYPASETWLGTTVERVAQELGSDRALLHSRVQQTTLDLFVEASGLKPDLLKVDTEGNEIHVLRGARRLLAEYPPLILFESWKGSGRSELFQLLGGYGYRIWTVDYVCTLSGLPPLTAAAFADEARMNFLAVPHRLSELPGCLAGRIAREKQALPRRERRRRDRLAGQE